MSTTVPPDRKPGLLTGLALLLPVTLSVMAVVALAPVLPQLQQAFKGTPHADFLVPMILTTPALCVTLFSWFAGVLGDRFSRRRLLLIALLFYGVVGIVPAFLHDLRAILLTRVGVGLAEAMIMTLSTALVGDVFEGRARDSWLASQTAVASIAALLLFNVGGMLGAFGWRAPFLVYASSILMLLGVALFTWESPPPANTSTGHVATSGAKFPWAVMMRLTVLTVFASMMFYTVIIQASAGLFLHGVTDPRRIGFLTSIASLAVPIGTVGFRFAAKLPVALLLAIEFSILGGGFVWMYWATDANQLLVGAAINQFGAGLLLPTLLTWNMRQLAFEFRGRGMGIWTAAFSLGQFFSPIAVTLIAARVGGLLGAFAVLGYVCIAAGMLALLTGLTRMGRRKPLALV